MKILLLSTSDIDGGAARAAYRLHRGLQNTGTDSQMLVQHKYSDDRHVFATSNNRIEESIAWSRIAIDNLPLKFYPHKQKTPFSPQWLSQKAIPKIDRFSPDIINLHWVDAGFLPIETIPKLNYPLVWTLHDMWWFTGGCHVAGTCDRYTQSCGACPQLGSSKEKDLSRWIWKRKMDKWKNLNLTLVCPSEWLAKCVGSSSLYQNWRVEVIHHGLDTHKFKPLDRLIARESLNLPQDKQLILFGALDATSDKNKGFHLLQQALQNLSQSGWRDKAEVVVFGASKPKQPVDLGFQSNYLGQFKDDVSLALIYSAADVMVVPSLQESFGQTASESLACGTPVVAFDATGLRDIVDRNLNGYLAKPYEIEDLARGIAWVLEDPERYQQLAYHARQKVEKEFELDTQARRYSSLFQEVLDSYHRH